MPPTSRPRPCRRAALLGLSLVALAAAGCGGKTYPVEGQVVYPDGTPAKELAGYVLSFDAHERKVGGNAVVGADGGFVLGTFTDGDGAPPGTYRVALNPPIGDGYLRAKSLLHPRYASPETSRIEVTVKPERNRVQITVERARR